MAPFFCFFWSTPGWVNAMLVFFSRVWCFGRFVFRSWAPWGSIKAKNASRRRVYFFFATLANVGVFSSPPPPPPLPSTLPCSPPVLPTATPSLSVRVRNYAVVQLDTVDHGGYDRATQARARQSGLRLVLLLLRAAPEGR